MDQYIIIIGVLFAIACGVIIGIKVMPYFKKENLTSDQLNLLLEVQNYAKILKDKLENELGDTEEKQKETLVELIKMQYPKLDEKIIGLIVEYAEKLIEDKVLK
jgi:hypothetical protein